MLVICVNDLKYTIDGFYKLWKQKDSSCIKNGQNQMACCFFFGLSMKGKIISIFLTIYCLICHCYPLKVLKLNIFSSNIMQRVLSFVLPHIIVEHR